MSKVMTVGKYKDQEFKNIPKDYLEWFVSHASYDNLGVARDIREYLVGEEILLNANAALLTKGEYTISRQEVGKYWNWVISNVPLLFRNKPVNIIKRKENNDEVMVLMNVSI